MDVFHKISISVVHHIGWISSIQNENDIFSIKITIFGFLRTFGIVFFTQEWVQPKSFAACFYGINTRWRSPLQQNGLIIIMECQLHRIDTTLLLIIPLSIRWIDFLPVTWSDQFGWDLKEKQQNFVYSVNKNCGNFLYYLLFLFKQMLRVQAYRLECL